MGKYDNVTKPLHYCSVGEIEPKDFIRSWNLNYNLGNVIKYLSRAGRKGDSLEDLRKAKQYIMFEIEAQKAGMPFYDSNSYGINITRYVIDKEFNVRRSRIIEYVIESRVFYGYDPIPVQKLERAKRLLTAEINAEMALRALVKPELHAGFKDQAESIMNK